MASGKRREKGDGWREGGQNGVRPGSICKREDKAELTKKEEKRKRARLARERTRETESRERANVYHLAIASPARSKSPVRNLPRGVGHP